MEPVDVYFPYGEKAGKTLATVGGRPLLLTLGMRRSQGSPTRVRMVLADVSLRNQADQIVTLAHFRAEMN